MTQMTLTTAREIADDILSGYDAMDRQLQNPGRCVTALNVLEDSGHVDRVNAVYDIVPGLMNYDADGNWTGPAYNENGWTA